MSEKPVDLNLVVTSGGVPVADQEQGIRDFKAACLRSERQKLTPSQMWANITDAVMADIMAMTDEEVLKEAAEDGESIHDVAERARARIEKAMAEAKRRHQR